MLLNLKRITQERFEQILVRIGLMEERQLHSAFNDGVLRKVFPLRGKSIPSTPFIELLGDFPRTQRIVDTMAKFDGKLLTATGFECKVLAFKSDGPFELIVCGRRLAAADEAGCYEFVENRAADALEASLLVARTDTFEFRRGGVTGTGVEFAALAIVEQSEILPPAPTMH